MCQVEYSRCMKKLVSGFNDIGDICFVGVGAWGAHSCQVAVFTAKLHKTGRRKRLLAINFGS